MKEIEPKRRAMAALAVALSALLLPACSDGAEDTSAATAEPSSETLAALLAADDELSAVSGAMGDAGLAQIFDGTASYTMLAPSDGAFDALGEVGNDLRSAEQRAAMIAILRDHIVPGYLTPDDISNAIEMDDDKRVQMRTMGDHVLTFTSEGDTTIVTAEDGARARIAGEALLGGNGVAIPVDAVLKRVETTQNGAQ